MTKTSKQREAARISGGQPKRRENNRTDFVSFPKVRPFKS
jgi:hypothetical protein